MESIAPPVARQDQVQPFSDGQVQALLAAAHTSIAPKRNEAIILFLVDTGVRASELCGLKARDLDLTAKRATVHGKGNKSRTVYFGRKTAKALWNYMKSDREPDSPVFRSDRGLRASEELTTSGLRQLFERLGKVAQIDATRCSPHTCRHYFAVSFLRAGGNEFSLQQLLGHSSLVMTSKYVNFARSDIERQHRAFSPADRLSSGK
jgi:integrase/recombinase XerD